MKMEQTFEEQCKEDSRLAKDFIFVCKNLHLICDTTRGIITEETKPKATKRRGTLVDCVCCACKNTFKRSTAKIKQKENGKFFCSITCRNEFRIAEFRLTLPCYLCGKLKSRLKRLDKKRKRHFCSNRCTSLFYKNYTKAAAARSQAPLQASCP